MKEKRTIQRFLLTQYLTVYNSADNLALGRIVDLTPKGFRMISGKQIEVDSIYRVKFEAPFSSGEFGWIVLQAKSLWSRPDINPDFYDTGFIFTDIDPVSKIAVDEVIKNLKFDAPD